MAGTRIDTAPNHVLTFIAGQHDATNITAGDGDVDLLGARVNVDGEGAVEELFQRHIDQIEPKRRLDGASGTLLLHLGRSKIRERNDVAEFCGDSGMAVREWLPMMQRQQAG